MNKKTTLFILITLTTMLILLTSANATNIENNTNNNGIDKVSEKTTTEPVVKEVKNKESPEKQATTKKQIIKENKTNKNTKTSTKTIEVNDGNTLVEAFNDANSDTNNDKYIINLNNGNYNISEMLIYQSTGTVKTLEINGNNNTINSTMFIRCAKDNNLILNDLNVYCSIMLTQGDLTINKTTINPSMQLSNMNITRFINSTIDYKIINMQESFTIIIDDDCLLGENFLVEGNGKVITNLTTDPYDGNIEINNENITKDITIPTTGNITLINCQINAKITNNGNLTLQNCSLSNNDMTTSGSKTDGFLLENKGTLTMIGCVMENNSFEITGTGDGRLSGVIVNQNNAILSLNNTIFRNNTNTGLENSLIYNLGIINSLNNCTVTDNNILFYLNKGYRYYQTEYNPDEFVLNVTDSLFENNTYKVFEAINMTVTNSQFNNNKYIFLESGTSGGGTGPTGIAITATNLNVDNCTFDANGIISKHQYVDKGEYGGAISTTNLTVNNSRFTNNILNTTSTWTTRGGSGAAIYTINGEITNSQFENNTASSQNSRSLPTIGQESYGVSYDGELPGSGADIYSQGNIIIQNNTFTNSYAKNQAGSIYSYVKSFYGTQNNILITDNTFTNIKSSQDTIVIEQNDAEGYNSNILLENNEYNNVTIKSEVTWNIQNKVYVNDTITATYNIVNPEYYDPDLKDSITFDIYVDNTYLKTVPANEEISIIFNESGQYLVVIKPSITSDEYFKVISLLEANDIIITPENYDTYIYRNQLIRASKDSRVFFQGEFNNKEEILIQTNDITIDGSQATFTNTQFTIEANNTEIKNLNIHNTQSNNYAIYNTGNNNNITNNNIIMKNTEGRTTGIYNQANNTIIANNTISIDGPAASIDYSTELGIAETQAILLIGGDKNKVEYNKILVTSTQTSSKYGTIEGITNHKNATNTLISYNNVTVTGKANFNYAINSLGNVENITISYNNILVTGERYCDGIQVGSGAKLIYIGHNNITCHCHNTTPLEIEEALSYGIVTTSMGFENSEKIHIALNNINLTGTVNYGIEIYRTDETNVIYNNITANGTYSMGIGYSHSKYSSSYNPNEQPYVGSSIQLNRIRLIGNSTKQINLVTEELQPENVGILIQQDSENHYITQNNINVNDYGYQDTCVKIKSNNQTISGNHGRTRNKTGNDTLYLEPGLENIILRTGNFGEIPAIYGDENIHTTLDFTIPETSIVNHPVTLEINLIDDYGNQPLNTYEIIRLRLEINNEIPQTLVLNHTNTYTFTPTTPGEYNITITLPENVIYYSSTQTKTLTVNPKPETQANITDTNITIGDSTTLTATFYDDDDQPVPDGMAIFKLNGKTLRDDQGNVIYVPVTNGQATLPDVNITQEWMKPDTTIQAVYVGNDNNEPITTKPTTVTVTKPEATITLEAPTEATAGETITLKATVTDCDKELNSGRVAFKLNGKTLKDPETGKALYATVENGVATITYTIPEKTKTKEYTLTAVFTETKYDRVEAEKILNVVKA